MTLSLLVSVFCYAAAEETPVLSVKVNKAEVKRKGKAKLVFSLKNTDYQIAAYSFDLYLPSGITLTTDANDKNDVEYINRAEGLLQQPMVVDHTAGDEYAAKDEQVGRGPYAIGALQTSTTYVAKGEGEIMTYGISADNTIKDGTYPCKVKKIVVTDPDKAQSLHPAEVDFNLVIKGEIVTIVLDENSETAPTANDEEAPVQVKRTIKANEWSTICLPFAMSESEVKTAFGDDVKMADFKGWKATTTNDITSVDLEFTSRETSKGIEANSPCMIKTSKAISDFTVEDKLITLPEDGDDPSITITQGSGKKAKSGYFTGCYKKITIDSEYLFFSGNKLYYSMGNTTMKGYRAALYVPDVATGFEDNSEAKVNLFIDGEETITTGIEDVNVKKVNNGRIYNLQGVYVGNDMSVLPAGTYICNGKKFIAK